ncbi:hypothetical protein [Ruminococcus flavefaciens]|uniref:hypothetical protein n=1 Tax=Ruminococcus flavefaciens TaxID=1265 RepID=UPI0026E964B8|nr:hypothetical protein [Ruminococcus flavefaciens]
MKRIIALTCFASLLLAGCGKTGNSSSSSESGSTTTEPVSTTAASAEDTTAAEITTTEAASTTDESKTEADTTKEPDGMVSAGGRMDMYPAVYQAEVKRVFDETAAENNGMASIEYALRDLDVDGIPELILKYGTCEADFRIHIYRFDEECELQDLGVFGGGHTSFCYDENTGDFVLLWGHMGSASIMYNVWENGTLKQTDHYDFTLDEQNPSYDAVLEEKGIKRMEFVGAYTIDSNSGIKSYFQHGDGTSEEFDGLYLDYIC